MKLAETQTLFAALISGATQVSPERLARFVGAGAPPQSLRRRLDVYAQSLRSRCRPLHPA